MAAPVLVGSHLNIAHWTASEIAHTPGRPALPLLRYGMLHILAMTLLLILHTDASGTYRCRNRCQWMLARA